MAIVMSDRYGGTVGASFAGDAVYANFSGTAPKYIADANNRCGLQHTAATAGIIAETFSGATVRRFDRIYLISATPTASCALIDIRDGSAAAICKAIITASTGTLQLQNAAGSTLTGGISASAVPIGTRFRIAYTLNGTAWSAVIFNNDTDTTVRQTLTPSGTITGGTAVSCREGFITAGGMGASVTLATFWPQDGDTTTPGLRPTAGVGVTKDLAAMTRAHFF